MRLNTILQSETSLDTIAKRIYGRLDRDSMEIARTALITANPDLQQPGALRPGTIIRIPETPDLKPKAATNGGDDPVEMVREHLRVALMNYELTIQENIDIEKIIVREEEDLLERLPEKLRDVAPNLVNNIKAHIKARKQYLKNDTIVAIRSAAAGIAGI
jgi:hypothetical protein